jgi:uncharacterized protein (DUF4415 family)
MAHRLRFRPVSHGNRPIVLSLARGVKGPQYSLRRHLQTMEHLLRTHAPTYFRTLHAGRRQLLWKTSKVFSGPSDRIKDTEISYKDIPPLDKSFLKRATTAWPPVKKQLTIRLDADVLAWLKAEGRGYQTRINHILRVVMESQPGTRFDEIPASRFPTRETSKPRAASGVSRARAR